MEGCLSSGVLLPHLPLLGVGLRRNAAGVGVGYGGKTLVCFLFRSLFFVFYRVFRLVSFRAAPPPPRARALRGQMTGNTS